MSSWIKFRGEGGMNDADCEMSVKDASYLYVSQWRNSILQSPSSHYQTQPNLSAPSWQLLHPSSLVSFCNHFYHQTRDMHQNSLQQETWCIHASSPQHSIRRRDNHSLSPLLPSPRQLQLRTPKDTEMRPSHGHQAAHQTQQSRHAMTR